MGLTPMMKQYLEIKEQYGDSILFFRLGDFYEMFMDDAKTASAILEITLTGRDAGLEERIPMCGIPYHAASGYIRKLLDKGMKVAICEQVEDPKTTKGIVRREVTRIITPGTIMEEAGLSEKNNNYIAACCGTENHLGLAYADITTGELRTTAISHDKGIEALLEEIEGLDIKEVVTDDDAMRLSLENRGIYTTIYKINDDASGFELDFSKETAGYEACWKSLKLLDSYLSYTQKNNKGNLLKAEYYLINKYMAIDTWSRQNLEISRNIRTGDSRNTLLSILDKTRTAFGGRLLKRWLEQPLLDLDEIRKRQAVVELFCEDLYFTHSVRNGLKGVYDIERILGRLSFGSGNGKDLLALKLSLQNIREVRKMLTDKDSVHLASFIRELELEDYLIDYLEQAIDEDPPFTISEGGIIKTGFNQEVDLLRKMSNDSKTMIKDLESRERERLGIKNLKVGYNKVFGYYLEISKSYSHLAPMDYIRKQTIAGGERFINEELKNLEHELLHSKEKLTALEYQLYMEVKDLVLTHAEKLKVAASCLARLDVLSSFAHVAQMNNYVKPVLNNERTYILKKGRHPMVEQLIEAESYVDNDFDIGDKNLGIITGPNMAGKSTFIRMLAVLAVMAQCGSYVPAEYIEIGIVDRVFARVGASDDLASGHSTFMVEMNEVASILSNATDKSLIILDEVGRGTSTLDGLAIAWAVSEFLLTRIKARTVFATHYHELVDLENHFDNVFNLSMAVQEYRDQIVFLRKIVPGGADQSYGIHVARMAGLPEELLRRAEEKMEQFEQPDKQRERQLTLEIVEKDNPFVELLCKVNPNELTPLEALELIYKMKKETQERR